MSGLNPRIGYGTPEYEAGLNQNEEQVRLHTLGVYEQLWFENIAANMPLINAGKDLKDLPKTPKRPALIIAGGPSVEKHGQLKTIREHPAYEKRLFTTIACDKMLKPCVAADIRPDICVMMDATPGIIKFFTDVPRQPGMYVAASIIANPKAVLAASLTGELCWWMPLWDNIQREMSYTRAVYWMTKKVILQTLGNVGSASIFVALHRGCDPAAFVGLDLGYPAETPIEEDQYYKAYVELVKQRNAQYDAFNAKAQKDYAKQLKDHERRKRLNPRPIDPTALLPPQPPRKIEHLTVYNCYRYVINPDTQKHILVGLNWDVYRRTFINFIKASQLRPEAEAKRTFINLSPESSVFGEGIQTRDLKEWLDGLVKA